MKFNITCKQAVDYISKKEEGKLSAGQRFGLWCHLLTCSLCRLFAKQNKMIIKAFKGQQEDVKQLSPEEKQKMIDTILPKQ
jgi:hypothetical protein